MTDPTPVEIYKAELARLKITLHQHRKRKDGYTWMRLISFLAALAGLLCLLSVNAYMAVIVFILALSIFVYIVSKDITNTDSIDNIKLLIQINEKELGALAYQYLDFPDGSQWKPTIHEYANDLDIFGRASLFQYINRTSSEQGNVLLAKWLLFPASEAMIRQRQNAIKELQSRTDWRQQLQAYGNTQMVTERTQQNIRTWLVDKNRFIDKIFWKLLRFILPLLSMTVLIFYLIDIISIQSFFPLMLLFLAIAFAISKMIMPAYARLGKITAELETLSASIRWIENTTFNDPLLQQLQKTYTGSEGRASQTVGILKKILARLDYRLNPLVFIPLSIFLSWDLQQIFALEKWKIRNQKNIDGWFSSLAEIEVLSTLANLSFNQPDWCFPVLTNEEYVLITGSMGHPLIPENNRINNTFSTEGGGAINLITGSNMAGKSTFLRSVGVNIVLGMMGAPVCARSFTFSPMKVMSSMRVNDNLEESTSTFYAELKKLKEIIEAVNDKEKIFLILDEILRGTNSADRYTGSIALIKQLIRHKATGLIATHDLELAKLADEYPANIHNYHFDVRVTNNELFFDYKLQKGVCRSMNASILMKKIGIEL